MDLNIFVPLHGFSLKEEKDFYFGDFGVLSRKKPDLKIEGDVKAFISEDELREIEQEWFWLKFAHQKTETLKPVILVNLFLLSIWIIKPTHTQARFRIEGNENQVTGFARYHDPFQHIKGQAQLGSFNSQELEQAAYIFSQLRKIYSQKKRLKHSIIFTFYGCTTTHWQVAFSSFSSAIESLLTYSEKPRLTHRLAKSYACLIQLTKRERHKAFKRFERLYSIRSDILHGRGYKLDDPKKNLEKLVDYSDLLRDLWRHILSDKKLIYQLSRSDNKRELFFKKMESEYVCSRHSHKPVSCDS